MEEKIAKMLYGWLHNTGSPDWESKKVPEVVRVGYRKRAYEVIQALEQLAYRKLEPLTPEEIGDNLDLEVDATYPRSNGSLISTISVDKLLQAQLDKGGG